MRATAGVVHPYTGIPVRATPQKSLHFSQLKQHLHSNLKLAIQSGCSWLCKEPDINICPALVFLQQMSMACEVCGCSVLRRGSQAVPWLARWVQATAWEQQQQLHVLMDWSDPTVPLINTCCFYPTLFGCTALPSPVISPWVTSTMLRAAVPKMSRQTSADETSHKSRPHGWALHLCAEQLHCSPGPAKHNGCNDSLLREHQPTPLGSISQQVPSTAALLVTFYLSNVIITHSRVDSIGALDPGNTSWTLSEVPVYKVWNTFKLKSDALLLEGFIHPECYFYTIINLSRDDHPI